MNFLVCLCVQCRGNTNCGINNYACMACKFLVLVLIHKHVVLLSGKYIKWRIVFCWVVILCSFVDYISEQSKILVTTFRITFYYNPEDNTPELHC
jgi:hypothetical protein